MKTILLTGATGFLGQNFLKYFSSHIPEGVRLVLLTSREIPGYVCVPHKNHTYCAMDFLKEGVDHIDVVIHMGAFTAHTVEQHSAVSKHYDSVRNTVHLIENLPNVPDKIVYLSSIAVYGFYYYEENPAPYVPSEKIKDENSAVDPHSWYAYAKFFGEGILNEYAKRMGTQLVILRVGSVYGPNCRNLLGSMLKALKNGSLFHGYAPPKCIWNFVYIEDICAWILQAALCDNASGVINLTSSENHCSLELYKIMKKAVPEFQYVLEEREEYFGTDKWFDSSRRERILGKESVSLEEGLRKTWLALRENI